jgi:hypothetical protein
MIYFLIITGTIATLGMSWATWTLYCETKEN